MAYKRKTTRKSSRRKTSRSSSRGKSTSTSLSASQKKLKERQTPPWDRIKKAGITDPVAYDIPWEDRGAVRNIGAVNITGLGYIADGEFPSVEAYRYPEYSWEEYCTNRARMFSLENPHPQGEHSDDYTLRKDQQEDLMTILKQYNNKSPEFLNANETGTGKTVTSWKAVQVIRPKSILIVCPSAVIPVWRQHIRDMGDMNIRIVIINYESLKRLVAPPDRAVNAKKTTTQNKYIALDGNPYTYFDMVIFDEAHKLKNPTSQQSRISAKLAEKAKFVLRITATPGKDPSQLHHLYRGLSYITGDNVTVNHKEDNDFSSYVKWCTKQGIRGITKAPFGNGIKWEGRDDELKIMSTILYGNNHGRILGIKRKPQDWGDTVRQPLSIDLDEKSYRDYQMMVEDTKKNILQGFSKDRRDMTKGLAAMVSLRQKTGIIKAEHVVDYTQYCVKDLDEQVVISAIYKNTVETISEMLDRKKIPHTVITGDNTPTEKENNRRMFQQGEVPVIITSITTGISLHANETATHATSNKRRMIIADAHWSPIEHKQLEGRINRNGETGVITIPFLSGTIDEKVTKTLLKGLKSQSIIQDNNEEDELALLAQCLGISI